MTALLATTPVRRILATLATDLSDEIGAGPARIARELAVDFPAALRQRPAQLLKAARARPADLDRLLGAGGFSTLDDLRRRAESEVGRTLVASELRVTSRAGRSPATRELLPRILDRELDNVRSTLDRGERSGSFELVAQRIVGARTKLVAGELKSRAYATLLVSDLSASLPGVHLLDGSTGRTLDLLAAVGPPDVLIAFCLRRYSRSTVALAKVVSEAGGFVIGFTDRDDSPLGTLADLNVVVTTTSTPIESGPAADSPTAVAAAVHAVVTLATASAKGAGRRLARRGELARQLALYQEI